MSNEAALRERAELLDELRQIVQSMKNLAYAELQRLGRVRSAQQEAMQCVEAAWRGLVAPGGAQPPAGISLVIGSERGFCGAFNAPLVAACGELAPQGTVLVAGARLVRALPSAAAVVVLDGCAGLDDADAVLDGWMRALSERRTSHEGGQVVFQGAYGVERVPLWSAGEGGGEGATAAPNTRSAMAPLGRLALPPDVLRPALARQRARLLLQSALLTSLEQENHRRLAQMQRAQEHLDQLAQDLQHRRAAWRQASITNELETLVSAEAGPVWPGVTRAP